MEGECNCGAVRFRLSVEPYGVYVCHCSICRRHTGTNGNAVVVVENQNFQWLAGEEQVRTWRKPGHDWQIWFCAVCGSQLPGTNDAERMFVPAGLLADPTHRLKVLHHIWVDSKAGWDEIGDSGQQHPGALAPS